MLHALIALGVIYFLVHALFAGHRYRRSTRHRSFLHRCYISLPGPFGFRMSHRL